MSIARILSSLIVCGFSCGLLYAAAEAPETPEEDEALIRSVQAKREARLRFYEQRLLEQNQSAAVLPQVTAVQAQKPALPLQNPERTIEQPARLSLGEFVLFAVLILSSAGLLVFFMHRMKRSLSPY